MIFASGPIAKKFEYFRFNQDAASEDLRNCSFIFVGAATFGERDSLTTTASLMAVPESRAVTECNGEGFAFPETWLCCGRKEDLLKEGIYAER